MTTAGHAPGRRLLPTSASPVAAAIVAGRALRGFADGFVSVLLAQHLTDLGLSPVAVGAIVTATLVGSAALTLTFGLVAHRVGLGTLLVAACGLMAATGAGFAAFTTAVPLFVVALVGTLNPSAGDASVFLPTEQAILAGEATAEDRPRLYAAYNVAGTLAGALGALASGGPQLLVDHAGWTPVSAQRLGFVLYGVVALLVLALVRPIPGRLRAAPAPGVGSTPDPVAVPVAAPARSALGSSRGTVLRLAALFSLDSAGSGFVVTSMLVLWLHLRHGLSSGTTAAIFFASGLLGGCSQLLAPRLARRIGLVRTMAFTHIPANVLLALTAFAPDGRTAIALLLVRSLFAQMDAPARQAFVMAVVPAEHRAAASSVTNVPRSLSSATTPLLAGVLLTRTDFGWPLLLAGVAKLTYDLVLLRRYRHLDL